MCGGILCSVVMVVCVAVDGDDVSSGNDNGCAAVGGRIRRWSHDNLFG